ncbi:pyridoxamine 5'-phosphate oxidase [Spongiimicrobium salis]|uniref:pyridoxamine 5'-phosphate oxidase n=1 Tax=Spongiimicrobium salis TaxID=1667022 RepID=UPI00374CD3A5
MNPISLFKQWFSEELEKSTLDLPAACCLSTLSEDGYPNARFVSLKEVMDEAFIITGPLDSRKGKEIRHSAKAALTFWWTSMKRQVRIQGDVHKISEAAATIYFQERNRDSQIVSSVFEQGKPVENITHLEALFETEKKKVGNGPIARPEDWGGIAITPRRIEFMEFQNTRLHQRTLYTRANDDWTVAILQP